MRAGQQDLTDVFVYGQTEKIEFGHGVWGSHWVYYMKDGLFTAEKERYGPSRRMLSEDIVRLGKVRCKDFRKIYLFCNDYSYINLIVTIARVLLDTERALSLDTLPSSPIAGSTRGESLLNLPRAWRTLPARSSCARNTTCFTIVVSSFTTLSTISGVSSEDGSC